MSPALTPLYLFLDEGGNFDFSPSGTRFFTLSALTAVRPFTWDAPLTELRYDLLETGCDIEYFHASDDRQAVRDRVFGVIGRALASLVVDSLIVEKAKVNPDGRSESRLYPDLIGLLLRHVLELSPPTGREVIVITDRLPIHKKRDAVEKAVTTTLRHHLPADTRFRLLHHDSKSCLGLQVADYANWAMYRKWDRADDCSFQLVQTAVRSQPDVLSDRETRHY